ncbi:MAG: nucleotidyltransferase family protein [Lachnospiraceae bacterium]|nr:nucleotidyltransferase family protein [Lachnospiraceae bacterium]
MKNLAIIAEYNPFHNGHLYHLNKSKELTNANCTIALMSGNFLQRGVPAMWDKYTRSKMATTAGIDLVLELPFPYATGSAKDFASGAVNILNSLNSIDYLCFGAETDNIDLLTKIADIINTEPDYYKEQLNIELSKGLSFPHARTLAITNYIGSKHPDLINIINQPNNILAIEYIAALRKINSKIQPVIIKRHSAMYHDQTLYGSISSASAIRTHIQSNDFDMDKLKSDIPLEIYDIVVSNYNHTWPIDVDKLTPYIQYKLLNPCNYSEICDISLDMANKLNKLSPVSNYQDIIKALSSKDLTNTRISRSLIHLLLDYKEADRDMFLANNYSLYANILSFRKESSQLIKTINQQSSIPLITKKADFNKYLSNYKHINQNIAKTMWDLDTKATVLFNCLVYNSYGTILPSDYNIQLPII